MNRTTLSVWAGIVVVVLAIIGVTELSFRAHPVVVTTSYVVLGIVAIGILVGAWKLIELERSGRRETQRFRLGQCLKCGNDLNGFDADMHCPNCGETDVRLALRLRPIPPPWCVFDVFWASSFWRQGAGEAFYYPWLDWYRSLSDPERAAYRQQFPEPTDHWEGFYSFLDRAQREQLPPDPVLAAVAMGDRRRSQTQSQGRPLPEWLRRPSD